LTHDVEGTKGLGRVEKLMDLEAKYGFRSSFNFVPEWEYSLPEPLRNMMEQQGFEVGYMDWNMMESSTTRRPSSR